MFRVFLIERATVQDGRKGSSGDGGGTAVLDAGGLSVSLG